MQAESVHEQGWGAQCERNMLSMCRRHIALLGARQVRQLWSCRMHSSTSCSAFSDICTSGAG